MVLRSLLLNFAVVLFVGACAASEDDQLAWQDDVDAYAEQLEARHLNLFHTLGEDVFRAEVARLRQDGTRWSKEERVVALMRLTRRIGDGHTSIPLWGEELRRYPIEFTIVEDAVRVTGADDRRRDLLGQTLTAINSVPITEIFAQLAEIVPFVENDQSLKVRIGMYLPIEDILVGLGIVERGRPTTFTFDNEGMEHITAIAALDQKAHQALEMTRLSSVRPDDIFALVDRASNDLWFGASEGKETVYIRFDRYPGYDAMQPFGEDLQRFINRHQSSHLIIDLRNNFGGDFFVGLALASYLNLADSIEWEEGVYVLVGPKTFSAAMSNAVQFKQILGARWVGEAPGARPCGYQDMGQFTLPRSELVVTHSKRYFCFIDTEDDSLQPDVLVPARFDDLLAERDSVLTWVMGDIAGQLAN
ncbi:MAG: peptidase S41 [Pseudomonadota bacterium]